MIERTTGAAAPDPDNDHAAVVDDPEAYPSDGHHPDDEVTGETDSSQGEDPLTDNDAEPVDVTGVDLAPIAVFDQDATSGRRKATAILTRGQATTILTRGQAITILRALGWRVRSTDEFTAAVRRFQTGWNLGAELIVDGKVGPRTTAALRLSEARRRAGAGTASAHFSFSEFACKCGGRYSACPRINTRRSLLRGLEAYRARAGRTRIVSGTRCPQHNRAVGGATKSQHQYGAAADVDYALLDSDVARMRVFSGIGRSAHTHQVRHVDVRQVAGHNLTGGSPNHPTIWNYAR